MLANSHHASYEVRKWRAWLFCAFAAILLVTNVLLVRQNGNLKHQLDKEPPAWRPPVGTLVPPINGLGLNGEKVRLDWGFDARDTFLFVFSPRCGVCDLTWPAWQELTGSAATQAHRLAYVNVTPPLQPDYVKRMKLEDSLVLAELDPGSMVATNIRFTPEVIQISSSGKIEQVWMGLPEGDELASLKRALSKGN